MIVRLRYYLSVFFFMLCLTVFAQDFSISGKVVDGNGSPIEFANVIISAENEEAFFKGTSTDEKGIFKLEVLTSTTYFIRISFIGYEEFEQKVVLSGNLDLRTIQLKEIPESLSEVTVIAKKPTTTRKPDRLIFNVENTALIEGSTLSVLKSTPGVIVSDGSINIKSAPAAVYINNRRVQLTSDELMQLLENSPANSIKSIEVITNPPASYDADSGSVINIIMSKNLITGYRGSIQTNYTQGVFPRYNAATSHYFKNDKVNLNVNYSYTNQKINKDQDDTVNFLDNSNEIEEIWQSNVNRNRWSETHNLNLNFDYYIDDNNTLSLTSTGLYTPYFKYQIRNKTNIADENQNFLSSFTANNLSRDNKYNIGTNLIYKHDFENKASLSFNAHYTIYDYERDQNVFQDEPGVINDSEFKTLANLNTNIISGKVDYSWPVDETSNFDMGLKYSNVKTDSDITRLDIIDGAEVLNTDNTDVFKYDENVFAAYTNYSKTWDKWDLNLGLRVEQTNIEGESLTLSETNTQDYLNWFPNASLSHQISEGVSLYGSYKRSITRPSYTDLNPFTFFLNENMVILGNPNLVPSYRDHYKIGTNFMEHFTVEAYYMNYDGDIVELPRQNNQTNIVAITPTNLDKKVDYGFDFAFDYYLTDNWNIYAVTSFFNITEESKFDDDFVKLIQWSNYSELSNNVSLLKDNSLDMSLSLVWVGKSVLDLVTVEDRLFSSFSVTKTFFNKKMNVFLSVEDIFNFQNEDYRIKYLNQSSRRYTDVDNRFIKFGLRYKFGNTKLNTNERSTDVEERERLKDLN
ncbi:TonB-dependent receptor domain-containing protein [Winogradskyella sp. R77965]|uniref:TonB-dependent receptor domain-containing protein n=1 Tax=Winogradskyella sp. R77965 TaxID=3093872 RepID=UPI0037DD1D17